MELCRCSLADSFIIILRHSSFVNTFLKLFSTFFLFICFAFLTPKSNACFCAFLPYITNIKRTAELLQSFKSYSSNKDATLLNALSRKSPSKSSIAPASQAAASLGSMGILAKSSKEFSFAISST